MKINRTFISTLVTLESNTQKVALFIYILLFFSSLCILPTLSIPHHSRTTKRGYRRMSILDTLTLFRAL